MRSPAICAEVGALGRRRRGGQARPRWRWCCWRSRLHCRSRGCTVKGKFLNSEVKQLHRLGTLLRVRCARALFVRTLAVKPEQVLALPVADHGRHAISEGARKLSHALVLSQCHCKGATLAILRERHLHRPQGAILCGEGDGDLEGQQGVHALCPGAVLLGGEVQKATAVTATLARPVLAGVKGGVPGKAVCLHNVNLGTVHAADGVRIAIVVITLGGPCVLPHGDEVDSHVAAAVRAG
mmetsp:Transcript_47649/g.152044  ORF Transcript_47649/g.152044 Transcript_47649/m.152044 type:complete len:239 (-) Transcript_47649:386-1102(-)